MKLAFYFITIVVLLIFNIEASIAESSSNSTLLYSQLLENDLERKELLLMLELQQKAIHDKKLREALAKGPQGCQGTACSSACCTDSFCDGWHICWPNDQCSGIKCDTHGCGSQCFCDGWGYCVSNS